MRKIRFYKVSSLPVTPLENSVYFVKNGTETNLYVTDMNGVPSLVTVDGVVLTADWVKSLTIETPSNVENIFMFFTDVAIRVKKIYAVLSGGAGINITWSLRYDADRSAVGTELITGGTTTSSTTGNVITTFTNTDIPANSAIWLTTSALTGAVDQLSISLIYEKI